MADRKRKLLASTSNEKGPSTKKARTEVFSEEEVEAVVTYQKEKILLRIEELNREVRTLQGREERVEELEKEYRALTESIARHWMQLQNNLFLLVEQLPQAEPSHGDKMDTGEEEEETEETLADVLEEAVKSTLVSGTKQTKKCIPADDEEKAIHERMEEKAKKAHGILRRIVAAIEAERKRNSAIQDRLKELSGDGIAEEIASQHQEALEESTRLRQELDTLQASFARLATQHSEWRAKANALAEDLFTRTSERDQFEASLAVAQRKVDKLELALKQAGLAAASAGAHSVEGISAATSFPAVKHTAKMPFKKAAAAAATAIEKSSAEQSQLEEEVKGLRHSVGELEVVSKKRQEDVQDLQEQREQLLREITHAKLQSVVTEEAVYKSPVHQELLKRFTVLKSDLHQAQAQLQEERKNLHHLEEKAKEEQERARLVHREDLKKIQQEMESVQESLSRMTQERNSISHHMTVSRAQKPSKRTVSELKRLVESQEKHVKALAKECARLKGEWELKDGTEAEEDLIAEIDAMGEELRKMQEQNVRLTKQVGEKDDANAQLMSERIQGKMQEGLLKKEAQLEQQKAAVLEEKAEQLENLAAQKEAVTKNLSDQLSKVKESLRSVTASYDLTRQQLRDAVSSNSELKAQVTQLKTAQEEMKSKADEQLAHLERDARKAKKLEEENVTIKKKLERYSKPKSEDYLEEVLIDYKQMLNCPICKERRKTTVIAKCYHVFCRDCIERNLNLRKRRCPACQQPFSADDVKEIWLNFST